MSSSGHHFLRSKKTKPSPRPQPFDDDASNEDEIPPPPPHYEQHDEDTEESSDEENAEEDQDPITKPKQDPQTLAADLPVATPALDGVRQLALGTPSGAAYVAPSSNRIWQESMQLLLLREMVEYSENNGKCKVSLSYVSKFYNSLEDSPLQKFSINQILEKMKLIKKRYDNLCENGKGKTKGNPLHPELMELSKKLWGEAGKGKVRKWKRVKVEPVENAGDDDDQGDNSFKDGTVWENAMVRLMKEKFYYQENYTRQKIALMNNSTRDLLEKKWLKRKGKLNTAVVDFDRVENICLKALLPG